MFFRCPLVRACRIGYRCRLDRGAISAVKQIDATVRFMRNGHLRQSRVCEEGIVTLTLRIGSELVKSRATKEQVYRPHGTSR